MLIFIFGIVVSYVIIFLLFVSLQKNEAAGDSKDNRQLQGAIYKGCHDSNAINFEPNSMSSDSSMCEYNGCTHPDALNYNQNATQNDGSCVLCSGLYG